MCHIKGLGIHTTLLCPTKFLNFASDDDDVVARGCLCFGNKKTFVFINPKVVFIMTDTPASTLLSVGTATNYMMGYNAHFRID